MRASIGGQIMRASTVVSVLLGVGLLSASCKRTVEGEDQAWQANLRHAQELTAQYPGFANALREQQKRAEDAMAAARSVADKEQSAKKMADANAMLSSGFVSSLGQIDSRTRALRQKLVTATTDAEHGSDQAGAKVATDDAQRILRNVDDTLKSGAGDPDAANAVVRKIESDITSASANLDKVIASAKARKQEAAKSATAAAASGATQVATWKCSYCGQVNDASKMKCPNCGAPRPDPNAPPKGAKKK
jgi:rubrerythrin